MYERLATIIFVAGLESDVSAALESVRRALGDQIPEILRLAVRLDKVIGQDVISHTLAVINSPSGAQYDRSEMTDGWTGDERTQGGAPRVLCTTALGLESWTSPESRRHILLKSKVALTTLVTSPDGNCSARWY